MNFGVHAPWPADALERRPISALVPYARNARTHSDAQVDQIAASIREWGWTQPVLIDEAGMIIAGHGRVLAGLRLGLGEVPVIVARGWTEAQKRAYVIADNKLTENGGWDQALLRLEVGDLSAGGFDPALLGFSAAELAALNTRPGLTDPNEVPDPPANPITRRGDLWQLGRHRLLCGDATRAEDVTAVLAGAPNLMVTDPPYGVNYDPMWRREADLSAPKRGAVDNDERCDWTEAWRLFPGAVAYVWHSGLHAAEVQLSLEAAGFKLRAQIVWVKNRHVISRGHYHWQHEPVAYVTKEGAADEWRFVPEHEVATYGVGKGETAEWSGGRKQSTVWHIEQVNLETGHGTQKPVECMKRPIENNSAPGNVVYDPFVGSGTTIIAAEITARACCAVEINPVYVDVAIERWENFTGEKAKRA